jgi:hypothetical protein
MTPAERQRRRRSKLASEQRSMRQAALSPSADMALDRLARHWALPVTETIERAIVEAEAAITAGMTRKEQEAYHADQMARLLARAAKKGRA